MSLSRSIPAILRNDARRLARDRFLLGTAAYIFGVAVALRWVVPWLQHEVLAATGFDLAPYVPLGVSYFVLVNSAVLTGLVAGFLLLEQREERTIDALLVVPTPLAVSLGVVGSLVLLVGTGVAVVEGLVVGVGVPPFGALVASAALVAPTGVVMALLLAVVADNKVEAFATLKIISTMGLLPVAAYFLPEPLQFVAGVLPPYWACKIWWVAAEGGTGWAWMVVPGVLVSAGWVAVLMRRFRAVV